uniref:F-box domain-containing protein n=1 Tax=Oryza punctata TaxID=4537 RepID=A0A0E0JKW6_ORYPU
MGQVGFTARRSSPPPSDCGGDPTQPPPAKSRKTSHRVAIDSLGEDLLLEVFLRLPSLATLVRAALTCRAWRAAVASSPSFRRRFRELHPQPLLGVFCDPRSHDLPVFLPSHGRDRDVLAAIRGGDFLLTRHLRDLDDDAPLRWRVSDCRDGYLLLVNSDAGLVATVNPMAPWMTDFINMPFRITNSANNAADATGQDEYLPISLDVHLICSEEDPMSFQLVWLCHDESRVQATVFSNDTNGWCYLPWVDIEAKASSVAPHEGNKHWLKPGMQANGLIFWPFKNKEHMLMLDTNTMEFTVHEFPIFSEAQQGCSFAVGETKDDIPCIVCVVGTTVSVWMRKFDEKGVERWRFADSVLSSEEANQLGIHGGLKVVTINDGFVYLATTEMIFSLCIETKKIEKLFPMSFRSHHLHPYIMAWPPSLVGNYGKFAAPRLSHQCLTAN